MTMQSNDCEWNFHVSAPFNFIWIVLGLQRSRIVIVHSVVDTCRSDVVMCALILVLGCRFDHDDPFPSA